MKNTVLLSLKTNGTQQEANMSSSRSLLTLLNAVALGALTLGMAAPAAAQVPFSRVNGQGCPAGSVLLTFDEANANRDAACRVLQTWDIARLADGGSMDGPGYGCKTRPSDTRALGNALCRPAPPPSGGDISRAMGQACPPGTILLTFAEANANRDAACRVLQTWDIARLADGGSMDGPGYGCKTRPSDTRALGNALCRTFAAPPPPPPPPPVIDVSAVAGTYQGVHPHWRDTVILNPDGTYRRGNGDPGRYTFDGRTLVLNWQNWGPEPLVLQAPGRFAAPSGFTLTLQAPPPPPPPPPVIDVSAVAGTYQGVHPHWRDSVILNPDGTYRRGNGDPGRYTFDGRTLVLNWRNWGPETLVMQAPGRFAAPSNGFTLTAQVAPPVIDLSAVAGTYQGVHPHWRDAVILSPDGSYRRGNGDPGRFTFDGRTLVLNWRNWGPETLVQQAPGRFVAPSNGFTLTRR